MQIKRIIIGIVSVAIIAIVVTKLRSNRSQSVNNVYHYNKNAPINVSADTVQSQIIDDITAYAGTFESDKEVKISSESPGKIVNFMVDLGANVKKGQLLIELDHSLLTLQLSAIDVQIEGFRADVKRFTVLANADAIQGIQLEKAEMGLKTALIQRSTILEQIKKCSITAPFDGIITAKFSETGAFTSPGNPLLQLSNIQQLKLTIQVAEQELQHFKSNTNISVKVDAIPELSILGRISAIGSKSNMAHQFPVQITIFNTKEQKIKSGMFGKAYLNTKSLHPLIAIPSVAIVNSNKDPKVYVAKNGIAQLQTIVTGSNTQDKTIIVSGLKNGDIILTKGLKNLFDSAHIIIK